MKLFALAFGAHPDDVEMSAGGTLSMLNRNGNPFGIVDLTRGEMGTRGNAAIRAKEANDAAKILGADIRINLGIGDAGVEVTRKNLLKVIEVIRKYKPEMSSRRIERNTSEYALTHQLVSQAVFYYRSAEIENREVGSSQTEASFLLYAAQNLCPHSLC